VAVEINWKALVTSVAPALTGILAGPLAGGAVKILADQILGSSTGDQATDEAALASTLAGGLTPELRAAILAAETQVKLAVIAADVRKTEVEADTTKSFLADVQNARSHNADTVGILRLGYLINIASYLCIILIIVGCYLMVSGTNLKDINPIALASVSTILGAVVQWLFSNASQANSFFFGSSPGSRGAVSSMASAVTDTLKQVSK
jgi:hypothetical protein